MAYLVSNTAASGFRWAFVSSEDDNYSKHNRKIGYYAGDYIGNYWIKHKLGIKYKTMNIFDKKKPVFK